MPELTPRPLSELTTLQTGGTPARMIEATSTQELIDVLRDVWDSGDDWLVLGGGSNILAANSPFDGTVILVRTRGIEELPGAAPDRRRLKIAAGHNWDDVVVRAVERGLAGIEAMSGIPGTAGAAPIQNVGAYGQEIVDTLVEVELLDESTGEVSVVPAEELELGLRTSVLKRHGGQDPERSAVVLSLTLELEDVGVDPLPIRSDRIRAALGWELGAEHSLAQVRETVLAIRASKGMVLDPDDPDTRSAGSFFQNPVVSATIARSLPAALPRWPLASEATPDQVIPLDSYDGQLPSVVSQEPDVKVSAAWLIEHAGIKKGFRIPRSRARVSTKHALALTNDRGATGEEVAELARFIRLRVLSDTGLLLQPEPVPFGVEL